ncbi:MAG: hypothetical protein QXO68_02540, partial [Conexivisphaerales archaeon]
RSMFLLSSSAMLAFLSSHGQALGPWHNSDILSTLNGSKVSTLEVASLGVSVLPLHAIDFPLKVDAMLY